MRVEFLLQNRPFHHSLQVSVVFMALLQQRSTLQPTDYPIDATVHLKLIYTVQNFAHQLGSLLAFQTTLSQEHENLLHRSGPYPTNWQ